MARRGFPSTAHEYGKHDACIHCGMHRTNVERLSHVCKPWREQLQDEKEAGENDMSVADWRLGRDLESTRALLSRSGQEAMLRFELSELEKLDAKERPAN